MHDVNREEPSKFTPAQIEVEGERRRQARRALRKVNAIRNGDR